MNQSMNPGLAELLQYASYAAVMVHGDQTPPAQSPVPPTLVRPQAAPQLNERERTVQSLAKDYAGKPHAEILNRLGNGLGTQVINALKSQAPTLKQALVKHQSAVRAADAELGRAFAAEGIQVQHHSENDFTHVIVTQLDLLLDGAIPSVSTVLRAAFPDDSKKAKSIRNSRHGKRWKKAYKSDAVRLHPTEKAMRLELDPSDMNQRCTAGTFGQSLGINTTLFKSCDRITKLEARAQLLEQQMACTKTREALADAGAESSRDKVLALDAQGKGQTEIADMLGMSRNTVKSILRRSKNG